MISITVTGPERFENPVVAIVSRVEAKLSKTHSSTKFPLTITIEGNYRTKDLETVRKLYFDKGWKYVATETKEGFSGVDAEHGFQTVFIFDDEPPA